MIFITLRISGPLPFRFLPRLVLRWDFHCVMFHTNTNKAFIILSTTWYRYCSCKKEALSSEQDLTWHQKSHALLTTSTASRLCDHLQPHNNTLIPEYWYLEKVSLNKNCHWWHAAFEESVMCSPSLVAIDDRWCVWVRLALHSQRGVDVYKSGHRTKVRWVLVQCWKQNKQWTTSAATVVGGGVAGLNAGSGSKTECAKGKGCDGASKPTDRQPNRRNWFCAHTSGFRV